MLSNRKKKSSKTTRYQFASWAVCSKNSAEGVLHTFAYLGVQAGYIELKKDKHQNIYTLKNIDFKKSNFSLTHIHPKAPCSSLINYYVSVINAKKYDPNIFIKHAFNFFEGPLIDYLDYELGHGILISNHCFDGEYLSDYLYAKCLFPILSNEGISYSLVNYAEKLSPWLRDFNICMGDGTQIIHDDILLDYEDHDLAKRVISIDQRNFCARNWSEKTSPILNIGGACTSSKESEIFARQNFLDYCQNNDIPHEIPDCILEGGNIITTIKSQRPHVIIGKNLLPINAAYRNKINAAEYVDMKEIYYQYQYDANKKNKKFPKKLNKEYSSIHMGHIKEARSAIERSLFIPHKRTIWLDNYLYHLDVYICPGPDNIIFIQDELLTACVLEEEYREKPTPELRDAINIAISFAEKAGDILRANTKKLEKKGFSVVGVPAIAHLYDNNNPDQPCRMITNFVNGFGGYGKNGHFHITLTSRFKSMNNAFKRILNENGVDNVYFIGEPELVESILSRNGSLRCLSNQGSTVFGHLGGGSINHHEMPEEIYIDSRQAISYSEYEIDSEYSRDESDIEAQNHEFEEEAYYSSNNTNLLFNKRVTDSSSEEDYTYKKARRV